MCSRLCLSFFILLLAGAGCRHRAERGLPTLTALTGARLNEGALAELRARPVPASLNVAVFSDAHEDYNDLEDIIEEINAQTDLDFVVNAGDFTNHGEPEQYEVFLKIARALRGPVLTIPGNHDVERGGDKIFDRVFGPMAFSFDRGGFRFLFLKSTGGESPEILAGQIPLVAFMHVPRVPGPAGSGTAWRIAVNGHRHKFADGSVNGARTVQVARVRGRRWLRLELRADGGRAILFPDQKVLELVP